ncbi:HAD family hydrolase [Candidatus Bathyarchaeota archaeon]|nr:HAD family hydrolase [Candidatus Bathyarchaeota archaeon]
MMTSVKAVVFDLDGTLINSAIPFKEMKRKIISYLQSKGVTFELLNEEMLTVEILKLAVEDLKRKGFSEKQIAGALAQASKIMNEVELQSINNATLVDGVPETLKALKNRGLKLGLLTRSCHEYVKVMLTRFNLAKYFDAVAARDDVDQPKPSPEHAFYLLKLLGVDARETLFVGDHWSDAECARQAGLKFVFVGSWQGNRKVCELCYKSVNKVSDIVKIVDGI